MALRALSLLYHRVNSLQPDPWTLCVSPSHFAEQLDVISRLDPAPIITFDDGYADNLYQALPSLERFGVPARFFITSGKLGSRDEMWWDALDQAITPSNPNFSEEYQRAFDQLRLLPAKAIDEELASLFSKAGLSRSSRQDRRMMTPDEVCRLAESPLVEIGAHTVSHPVSSALRAADQIEEIRSSRNELQQLTGKGVRGFAYPNGMAADYTAQTVEIVKGAGFEYAYAAFEHRGQDIYQLPRVMIRDWDGEQFLKELRAAAERAGLSFGAQKS